MFNGFVCFGNQTFLIVCEVLEPVSEWLIRGWLRCFGEVVFVGDLTEFLEHLCAGFVGGWGRRSMTDPSHIASFSKGLTVGPEWD
jgi:hypothetical protein